MKPRVNVTDGRVVIRKLGLDEVVIGLFTWSEAHIRDEGGRRFGLNPTAHRDHTNDCIHLERMGPNDWFLGIGDAILNIRTLRGGKTRVVAVEGVR